MSINYLKYWQNISTIKTKRKEANKCLSVNLYFALKVLEEVIELTTNFLLTFVLGSKNVTAQIGTKTMGSFLLLSFEMNAVLLRHL